MGTPTYRSTSYDGKGSSRVPSSRATGTKSKSAMLEMLELLQEVEKCREVVDDKQKALDTAKKALDAAEKKVTAKMEELDPETKARLRKMMGGLGSVGQDGR